jgi:hypothetical protein
MAGAGVAQGEDAFAIVRRMHRGDAVYEKEEPASLA